MTTKELIAHLATLPQDLPIVIEYQGQGGCESCGCGAERQKILEADLIYNLETRIVFSPESGEDL